MISAHNVLLQTALVFVIIAGGLLVSSRRRGAGESLFPISVTQELKGLAILLVYFSHIGNFLVSDHRFLAPLSGISQVGVDLFLVLSGYGLSVSMLKRPQSKRAFYYRLVKLFIPFWLILTVLLVADALILDRDYGGGTIILGYLGVFLTSVLSQDINAPFWFITWITGCYLLFPLIFSKARLWLSALIMLVIGSLLVAIKPAFLSQIMFLYQLHYAAFPAGMLLAWLGYGQNPARLTPHWHRLMRQLSNLGVGQALLLRWSVMGLLLIGLAILNPHAHNHDNAWLRQLINLSAALLIVSLFVLKRLRLSLLGLLGIYSFELYLIHWPLLSRYDLLFANLPDWLATLLYLPILIGLGSLLQKFASKTDKLLRRTAA
jgi:peptidoglycan/LPS O-acetylase OafA/YrhL